MLATDLPFLHKYSPWRRDYHIIDLEHESKFLKNHFIKKAANEILICQKILAFAFIPLKNIHHQGKQWWTWKLQFIFIFNPF